MHNIYEKNRDQNIQLIKLYNSLFDKINYYEISYFIFVLLCLAPFEQLY